VAGDEEAPRGFGTDLHSAHRIERAERARLDRAECLARREPDERPHRDVRHGVGDRPEHDPPLADAPSADEPREAGDEDRVRNRRCERALLLGIPAGNDVWVALAWTLAIILVFAPLSAWRYRRVVAR
jgi:hypothetical protein